MLEFAFGSVTDVGTGAGIAMAEATMSFSGTKSQLPWSDNDMNVQPHVSIMTCFGHSNVKVSRDHF